MTLTEREKERQHTIETRLGIFCGSGRPTADQRAIAEQEASDHIHALEMTEWLEKEATL